MSFFLDIHAALDARLDALTGSTPIAWENTGYKPVKGTAHLRPTLLMSPSSLMDLNTLQHNEGIYQIDILYPLQDGAGASLTKADEIYTHFKTDLTLVSNSVTVHVKNISRAQPSIRDEGWYMTSIEIHFKCYAS